MQLSKEGGFIAYIQKIISSQDAQTLMMVFKDLVLKAYGEKSPDGKRFIKSQELSEAFSQTEAYSDFFMSLALDSDEATKFVNSIVPTDLSSSIEKSKSHVTDINSGN